MNGYLKQSTAGQVRTIGPFIDDTDFKTLENALTIANTDIVISINGGADTVKNSGGATAHGAGGIYTLTWDATDTASIGELFYSVKVAGALVAFGTYVVLDELVYDALFGTVALATTTNITAGTITTATNVTTVNGLAANVITAASIANGAIDAATFAAGAIDAAAIAADAGTEIGTAVWATATRVLTASTNLGDLDDAVLAILGTPAGASMSADIAAIEAQTDDIGAAGAGLNAIPWNPAWDAEVQSEATDALNAYDPPTHAELTAGFGTADDAVLAAIAAVAADLPTRITKNVALAKFPFLMVDSADHLTPKTGLTITANRSLDGAAFGACANAAVEISNGWYYIDLAAADLNANTVALLFTATGADARNITLITQPT